MSDTKLINNSQVKQALKLKGFLGDIVARLAMKVTGLDKVNDIYDHIKEYQGIEFAEKLLEYLNIDCDYNVQELDNIQQEGPYIIVSNHPFGAIDGMALLTVVGKRRSDVKILTNFLLSYIPNLYDYFFPVNPFTDKPGLRSSLKGLKMAKEHLNEGGILGLFPAGEVSSNNNKEGVVKDIPWQASIVKLIRGAGVPVIPVYFHGSNSKLFHFVGKLHPMLRTIRLPFEMANKHDKTIVMRIGQPVSVSEIEEYASDEELGRYLYNRTYALESDVYDFKNEADKGTSYSVAIAPAVDSDILVEELRSVKDKMLFETSSYQCYLCDMSDIPNMIKEIGMRREETFRNVGEGTNREIDLDDFDSYYKHLFIWQKDNKELVGAYRLGIGGDIYKSRGIKGFYSNSLFRYKNEMGRYLMRSIELGRSFVSVKYQREALALMLLIKGIMYSVMQYKDVRYLLGPVSISSSYPVFYRSLMIKYLNSRQSFAELKHFVRPVYPFKYKFFRVNPDDLLREKMESIEKFDRFLSKLSNGNYRMPTLLKKYLKLNAKIIDFNVDPEFNYCVDGLIMLNLNEIPKSEIDLLSKDFEDKSEIYKRFDINSND